MAFRDSNTLVSLSIDRSVKTWDTAPGKMLQRVTLDFGNFSVFTFAPNDQPFLATGSTNRVMLWNYQNGKLLKISETTDSNVSALAFTPDGKLLVIGTHKGVLRVLDIATRKITGTMDLDSPICALSASRKNIVVGYTDGTLAELSIGGKTSTDEVSVHNDAVTAIAFSPLEERFASGSADGTIKIWNAESLKLLVSLKGSAAAIISIAFDPDGQTLVSSTTDGTISGWRLPANP
jgi:WD40 repeat protein